MPDRPREEPAEQRPQSDDRVVPRWVKPLVVEYGHLAKLTRGASGTLVEAPGMRKSCL